MHGSTTRAGAGRLRPFAPAQRTDDQQADAISSVPYDGPHPLHAAALLAQSGAARAELVCVAVEAVFQIVSKFIEEFLS